jgi:hypothetical protein
MEEMRAGGPAAMEKYAGDPGRNYPKYPLQQCYIAPCRALTFQKFDRVHATRHEDPGEYRCHGSGTVARKPLDAAEPA